MQLYSLAMPCHAMPYHTTPTRLPLQPIQHVPSTSRILPPNLKRPLHTPPKLLHNPPLALPAPNRQIPPPIHTRLPVPRIRIDDQAPRLAQHNPPGAHVPRPAPGLPVHVDGAAGDGAQVQRRGTPRPQPVHHRATVLLRRRQPRERAGLDDVVGARAVGAPFDGHEALAQIGQRGGAGERERGGAVQEGAAAADRGVEGLREGVVDDADGGEQVDAEAEGDADVGVVVHEVGGAVDGVDDEGWAGGEARVGRVGFFAHEGDVGVFFAEGGRDHCFDGAVGFGDEVSGWEGGMS